MGFPGTGYTSQGSLTCPGRSAGFNLTGPADFLSAQSPTELRLTDLQISEYLNIHGMIFRPASYKMLIQYHFKKNKVGLRQHLNTFRGFLIKPKINADTKLTIVMWCWVLIRSTQRHVAAIPARFSLGLTWRSRYNQSSERLTIFIRKEVFSHPFKSRVRGFLRVYTDSTLQAG